MSTTPSCATVHLPNIYHHNPPPTLLTYRPSPAAAPQQTPRVRCNAWSTAPAHPATPESTRTPATYPPPPTRTPRHHLWPALQPGREGWSATYLRAAVRSILEIVPERTPVPRLFIMWLKVAEVVPMNRELRRLPVKRKFY